MQMRLCPNNHYFDKSLSDVCPHCGCGTDIDKADKAGKTCTTGKPGKLGKPEGEAGAYQASRGKNEPAGVASGRQNGAGRRTDEDRNAMPKNSGPTKAMIEFEIGFDPVVGWLVCVEGKNKGRDYRIHAENNFIGRDPSMDIAINDDEAVSRLNHAIVSYDARDKSYYFAQGTGRSIVRVNGKAMLSIAKLEAYDLLEIGETKLVFVPLCGKDFDWLAIR